MADHLHFQRARFTARLPSAYLYTPAHLWLGELGAGMWRVGYTKFALRMFGELVDLDFEVEPGADLEVGQSIGWIEGFKAVSEVFSPMDGGLLSLNPGFDDSLHALQRDPHCEGWLLLIAGEPPAGLLDVAAYAELLAETIDGLTAECS